MGISFHETFKLDEDSTVLEITGQYLPSSQLAKLGLQQRSKASQVKRCLYDVMAHTLQRVTTLSTDVHPNLWNSNTVNSCQIDVISSQVSCDWSMQIKMEAMLTVTMVTVVIYSTCSGCGHTLTTTKHG
jgi:hypothetical protein